MEGKMEGREEIRKRRKEGRNDERWKEGRKGGVKDRWKEEKTGKMYLTHVGTFLISLCHNGGETLSDI